MLVDAGPDPGLVDDCLRRLGIDRLPLVLLSHLDADHVTGLAGALEGREVLEVLTGPLAPTDDRLPAVRGIAERAGAAVGVLAAGESRTVGSALVEALAPDPSDAVPSADPNGLSLVVRVTQHGLRLLLTGDLGEESETRILRRGSTCAPTCSRCPTTAAGTPTRTSSPPPGPGWRWSRSGWTTATGTPPAGCSTGWPPTACGCTAPTSRATWPSWAPPAPGGWRSAGPTRSSAPSRPGRRTACPGPDGGPPGAVPAGRRCRSPVTR
ncbi:MBL fold metallo-hydrolase [Geodermatophilaceae bacterium NBWT11]|nr:MBL fold metallo-hydrolase [Geodermatophilaceae bacterium NBWT11]